MWFNSAIDLGHHETLLKTLSNRKQLGCKKKLCGHQNMRVSLLGFIVSLLEWFANQVGSGFESFDENIPLSALQVALHVLITES